MERVIKIIKYPFQSSYVNVLLFLLFRKFDDSDEPSAIREVNKLVAQQRLLKQEELMLDE